MVAREAHGTIYTHAGPEIGVASTKAFTLAAHRAVSLRAVPGADRGTVDRRREHALVEELTQASRTRFEKRCTPPIPPAKQLAKVYSTARDFLYLGRGIHYPIALEGALKLKEISYIHAEGYPAGEMKHGPNALIDETLPVVVLATKDDANRGSKLRYEKTLSNIQEVTARSGKVIAVATEGDEQIGQLVDHVLVCSARPRAALAGTGCGSAAIAGVPHRGSSRMRRRPAAESGEVGDGGVGVLLMTLELRNLPLRAALSLLLLSFSILLSPAAIAQSEFHVNRDLYSETADPAADIAAAVKAARPAHKRILLEFGGNWCADCQLLDYYYRQSPNAELLAKHYVVVRVDIGHMDHNMDIASRYHVPVAKGVPALAVLGLERQAPVLGTG